MDIRFDPDWQHEADKAAERAHDLGMDLKIGFAIARARTLIMHRTPEQVETLLAQKGPQQ
jgi:hypothetical protein